MNKVYVPVLENSGGISIYGDRFFIDLVQCLQYINEVRPYLTKGEIIYYKTLSVYDF